jgi:hypothetical protein
MTRLYLKAVEKMGLATLGNLAEAGLDLRVILVRAGNNAAAVLDTAEFVSQITLNEFDGLNYVRKALASQAVAPDAANDRVEVTANANVWTLLGPGSGTIVGAIIYAHVTNDADSIPLCWFDDGGFPKPATGSDYTVTWPADGFMQLVCV